MPPDPTPAWPSPDDRRGTCKHRAKTLTPADYDLLFPWQRFFGSSTMFRRVLLAVLFFGLMPLLLVVVAEASALGLRGSLCLLQAYIIGFWAWALWRYLKPTGGVLRLGFLCGVVTVIAGIPVVLSMEVGSHFGNLLARFLWSFVGAGVLEELCKALPIMLLFVFHPRLAISARTGLILGVCAGLFLAAFEGVVTVEKNLREAVSVVVKKGIYAVAEINKQEKNNSDPRDEPDEGWLLKKMKPLMPKLLKDEETKSHITAEIARLAGREAPTEGDRKGVDVFFNTFSGLLSPSGSPPAAAAPVAKQTSAWKEMMEILEGPLARFNAGLPQAFGKEFLVLLFRLTVGPLLHAAWGGMVGWFIGTAYAQGPARWQTWRPIALGFGCAAVLHGSYDYLLAFSSKVLWVSALLNMGGIAAAALSILLLIGYARVSSPAGAECRTNPS